MHHIVQIFVGKFLMYVIIILGSFSVFHWHVNVTLLVAINSRALGAIQNAAEVWKIDAVRLIYRAWFHKKKQLCVRVTVVVLVCLLPLELLHTHLIYRVENKVPLGFSCKWKCGILENALFKSYGISVIFSYNKLWMYKSDSDGFFSTIVVYRSIAILIRTPLLHDWLRSCKL